MPYKNYTYIYKDNGVEKKWRLSSNSEQPPSFETIKKIIKKYKGFDVEVIDRINKFLPKENKEILDEILNNLLEKKCMTCIQLQDKLKRIIGDKLIDINVKRFEVSVTYKENDKIVDYIYTF